MALSANTVWEVRTTGSATGGGGFVAGASGVDFSQQDSAQYSVTDGVTAGTTTITSATAAFGTDVVGNIIYVAGGTGSVTAGWYQIASRTNSTTIVVDRSTGLTAGTGVTLKIGGALDHPATLAPIMVASNKAFVKAGSGYTTSTGVTFSQSVTPAATVPANELIGYGTVRGDNLRATLTLSAASITGLTFSGTGWAVRNIAVNCASGASTKGIVAGQFAEISNCKISNFGLYGINTTAANNVIEDCEVTGGTSGFAVVAGSTSTTITGCNIHDNVSVGINSSQTSTCMDNLITNNTGATSDGIQCGYNCVIKGNTVYGSGRHGVNQSGNAFGIPGQWRKNILAGNGGYGMVGATATGNAAAPWWDGNAFWNNTSGTRSNMDDTSTNPINGVSPYTNVLDVILTGDPFVAKASNDYRLNSTAGAGAACRGHGVPTGWPGNSLTTSAPDMGAAQHADAGGGLIVNPGMTGL